jgi:hypothetical protein
VDAVHQTATRIELKKRELWSTLKFCLGPHHDAGALAKPADLCYNPYQEYDAMSDTEKLSIFDIEPDEALQARLDAEAEAEIDAGKGVPQERVRDWLARLAKGERLPPPVA